VGILALIGSVLSLLLAIAPATAQDCVGDCNGDGRVAINELVTGVGISLGSLPLSACEVLDANGSEAVEINELILAVSNSLNDCRPPGPTNTPGTGVPTPTPTGSPNDCPLDPGRYTITQGTGGWLRVATFSEFPFPAGGTLVLDVGAGDANCRHPVVIPGEGGFDAPAFCIPALGLTTHVAQDACGVGQIASEGGADYTVNEIGDTSDTNGPCNFPQETCVTFAGEDSSVRVNITVGDGTPDTCDSGTANAIVAVPVHTVTWLEQVMPGTPGQCPGVDGTYDPDTSMGDQFPDMLVVEFDQVLDFTTDTTVATWDDLDDDGCGLAGLGPATGFAVGEPPVCFPMATPDPLGCRGACMDLTAQTVTTVASGTVGSNGSPTFDITFVTYLPNTYEGPDTTTTPATCASPPVINFGGSADRCLSGSE
jgi:hypothetical protein